MDSNENLDLPDGWLPCDGHSIENGPWAGGATPNLNTNGHFLRGGNENDVMVFEEDQIHDHEHTDAGHSHSSPPHSHPYLEHSSTSAVHIGPQNAYGGGEWTDGDISRTTTPTSVPIDNAKSSIGGVSSSYRSGDETRPRNMKVIWVMKCW